LLKSDVMQLTGANSSGVYDVDTACHRMTRRAAITVNERQPCKLRERKDFGQCLAGRPHFQPARHPIRVSTLSWIVPASAAFALAVTSSIPFGNDLMTSPSPKSTQGFRLLRCRAGRPSFRVRLRSVRPSLLDPRFRGDAWLVACADGLASLYLENSCLVRLRLISFDVASLNVALQRMRWCRPCCRGAG
jgi:hypothetical protein